MVQFTVENIINPPFLEMRNWCRIRQKSSFPDYKVNKTKQSSYNGQNGSISRKAPNKSAYHQYHRPSACEMCWGWGSPKGRLLLSFLFIGPVALFAECSNA